MLNFSFKAHHSLLWEHLSKGCCVLFAFFSLFFFDFSLTLNKFVLSSSFT